MKSVIINRGPAYFSRMLNGARRVLNAKTAVFMALFAVFVLIPLRAMADEVGVISAMEGRADVVRVGGQQAVKLGLGDRVSMGDVLRTKSDGKLEIKFKDDTIVRIAAESRLKIDEYTFNPDNSRKKGGISLLRGKLRATVSKTQSVISAASGDSNFTIKTSSAVTGIRGTDVFVFYYNGMVGVVFADGHGFVYNPAKPANIVNISAGQAVFVKKDAPPAFTNSLGSGEVNQLIRDTTPADKKKGGTDSGGTGTGGTGTGGTDSGGTGNGTSSGGTGTGGTGTGGGGTSFTSGLDINTNFSSNSGTGTTGVDILVLPQDTAPPTDQYQLVKYTDVNPISVPVSITGPASVTNLHEAAFVLSSSDASSFLYSLDGGPFLSTGSTLTVSALTEGSHTLSVMTEGLSGAVSTSDYFWTTDYTSPTLSFVAVPASSTNASIANFVVTSNESVTYSYKLDSGNWVSSTDSFNLSGLAEGSHTVTVQATDAAGNSYVISYLWTADYTAPTFNLSKSATSTMGSTKATISVSADGATTYSYVLDGGYPVTSTSDLADVSEGTHILYITAYDDAGNAVTQSISFTIGIDSFVGTLVGTGSTYSGSTSGTIDSVLNAAWGSFTQRMGGSYTGPSGSTWTMHFGGDTYDSAHNQNGYWVEFIDGAYSGSQMDGSVTFRRLTATNYGHGADGVFTGSYDGAAGRWNGTASGTYAAYPLTFVSSVGTVAYFADPSLGQVNDGGIYGYLGSVDSFSTSNTTFFSMMGTYHVIATMPHLWYQNVASYNDFTYGSVTYDGSAYTGFLGGTEVNGVMEAKLAVIYIDASGNAGYALGSLTGSAYSDIGMFVMDGTMNAVTMQTASEVGGIVTSGTLLSQTVTSSYTGLATIISPSYDGDFTGIPLCSGCVSVTSDSYTKTHVSGLDWGVLNRTLSGAYTGTTSDNWQMMSEYVDSGAIIGSATDGTQWSGGKLAGRNYGYGADLATGSTWISVGDTFGTINASSYAYNAEQISVYLNTVRYLNMIGTADGQAKLTSLNIPFAEVGRANLSGTDGNLAVSMNNVVFLAYNTGAASKIWATNSVTGTYVSDPTRSTVVALTGGGLAANFTVQQWTGGAWMSTVSGSGTYSGTGTQNGSAITIRGAAAGTYGGGSLSGTAAGVVRH